VIEEVIMRELSDAWMRHHPQEGQTALASLIWHVAR
jgi:hypothetical protein